MNRMAEKRAPKWINAFLEMLQTQCDMVAVVHTLHVAKNGKINSHT